MPAGNYTNKDIKDILRKHGARLEGSINSSKINKESYSQEYVTFKNELAPELSRYERLCKGLGSIVKLKVSKKDEDKVKRAIEVAHLDIEPWQALTLSVMAFISIFFIGIFLFFMSEMAF